MSSKFKSALLVKGNKGKSVSMIKTDQSVTMSGNLLPKMDEENVSKVRLSEGPDPSRAVSNLILKEKLQKGSSQFLSFPNCEIETKLSMTPSKQKLKKKGKSKTKKSEVSLRGRNSSLRQSEASAGSRKDEDEFEDDSNGEDDEEALTTRSRSSKKFKKKKKREGRATGDSSTPFLAQASFLGKKKIKEKKSKVLLNQEVEEKADTDDVEEDQIAAELARIKVSILSNLGHDKDLGTFISKETEISVGRSKGKKKKKLKDSIGKSSNVSKTLDSAILKQAEQQRIQKSEEIIIQGTEKQNREIMEQFIREEQLSKSIEAINEIADYKNKLAKTERENLEWQLYIDCGRLPNPSLCDQMTTYLHLWSVEIDETTVEEASKRSYDVIKLLNDLEDLLDSAVEENARTIENWKWIYNLIKEFQNSSLDIATYRVLKYIDMNMNRIDIPTADFHFRDDFVDMNLWLRLNLPIPLPNPRRPPKPRMDVYFQSLNVKLLFPPSMDGKNMAVRLMYLTYDHLSEQCQSYYQPAPTVREDLLKSTSKEWRTKLLYKYTQYMNQQFSNNISESQYKSELRNSEEIPIVPFQQLDPRPSDYYLLKEFERLLDYIKTFIQPSSPDILNLRNYNIIGGVYHIDLFYQPPQPQEYVTLNIKFATYSLPKELKKAPFYMEYKTPTTSNDNINLLKPSLQQLASIIRSSSMMVPFLSSQHSPEISTVTITETLLQITMPWPKNVIFLQPPIICRWDLDNKYWSTANISKVEYDNENHTITFKTDDFGIFAFATLRYNHLPFHNWKIIPEKDESVTVKLITAGLRINFNIKGGLICLALLKKNDDNCLTPIIGKYFKLSRLKRHLKAAGVDIFPEADASCYITNTSEKHEPMETHLYYNIAMLSNCFKFAWSQWNSSTGRRMIVLKMKEFCPSIDKIANPYLNLLVTPLNATFVNCTDSSPAFYYVEIENIKFSADLYNLMKVTSGIAIRNKVETNGKDKVFTLAQFLISIRLLSFS